MSAQSARSNRAEGRQVGGILGSTGLLSRMLSHTLDEYALVPQRCFSAICALCTRSSCSMLARVGTEDPACSMAGIAANIGDHRQYRKGSAAPYWISATLARTEADLEEQDTVYEWV